MAHHCLHSITPPPGLGTLAPAARHSSTHSTPTTHTMAIIRAAVAVTSVGGAVAAYQYWTRDTLPIHVRWHIAMARRKADEQRPKEAIHHYLQALSMMPPDDRTSVYLHDVIANTAFESGNPSLAINHFRATVQGLVQHGYDVNSAEVVELSLKLAQCYHMIGRHQDAVSGLAWCIGTIRMQREKDRAKTDNGYNDWDVRLVQGISGAWENDKL